MLSTEGGAGDELVTVVRNAAASRNVIWRALRLETVIPTPLPLTSLTNCLRRHLFRPDLFSFRHKVVVLTVMKSPIVGLISDEKVDSVQKMRQWSIRRSLHIRLLGTPCVAFTEQGRSEFILDIVITRILPRHMYFARLTGTSETFLKRKCVAKIGPQSSYRNEG